jgi:nicotinamidase/pyrazinamidase
MDSKKSLLIIDMQYDFMEGGALAVAQANELIAPINQLMELDWDLIVASQDWHPHKHMSFASSHPGKAVFEEIILTGESKQRLWPDHCIQHSHGAAMNTELNLSKIDEFILKGQDPAVDSYSAFFDNNHQKKTELDTLLRAHHITDIYVVGLAGDYCVKFTALDGKQLGYKTFFISDATRLVEPTKSDWVRTELEKNEIEVIRVADLN